MKIRSLFIIIFYFFVPVSLSAQIIHHLIQEMTPSGQIKYTVIEEDLSLRNHPEQISQNVIYKKISFPQDPSVMVEALKKSFFQKNKIKAAQPLWVATKNAWTEQDEKDYQIWFQSQTSTDFNLGTALLADCADVALLFRWAYAHDKQLPVANTLSGSGKLFGHFSSSAAWDKWPRDPDWRKDERFKQAMRYLFDNTNTHSIYNDLYPTQINSDYVHPGSVYMILRKSSGHAQTVFSFDQARAGLRSLWGNEPASDNINESYFIWEPAVKNMFGLWRWPLYQNGTWKLKTPQSMPGYSEEQFTKRKELDEDDFQLWVLGRLGLVDYDESRLSRHLLTVKEALDYRLETTSEGALICGFTPCDPKGDDWDNYSTTTRDARLLSSQQDLLKTIQQIGGVNSALFQKVISKFDLDRIFLQGFPFTYQDFILNESILKKIRSDANLNWNQRWGLDQFPHKISQFQFLNQLLLLNLHRRIAWVDQANYYCIQNPCDLNSEYSLELVTSKLDRGLTKLAQQMIPLETDHEIIQSPDLFDIYQSYRNFSASKSYPGIFTSFFCENPDQCSLYDVVWKDQGLKRVQKWKSQPNDSMNSRWGL